MFHATMGCSKHCPSTRTYALFAVLSAVAICQVQVQRPPCVQHPTIGQTEAVEGAYDRCTDITTADISDTVQQIEPYMFFQSSLRTIDFPDSIQRILQFAFGNNYWLHSIDLGNSLTFIGPGSFFGCSALPTIVLPDSVTNISYYTFMYCLSLESVTLSSSLVAIGNKSFENCSDLHSVSVPPSVTWIGASAFANCTSLRSISLPLNVTIADSAFTLSGCVQLTTFARGATVCDCTECTTVAPTTLPTATPSSIPTATPTTATPSMAPTHVPTTAGPTAIPTTATPSMTPTHVPTTAGPTLSPTATPTTLRPPAGPTDVPSTDTPTTVAPSIATTSTPATSPLSAGPTDALSSSTVNPVSTPSGTTASQNLTSVTGSQPAHTSTVSFGLASTRTTTTAQSVTSSLHPDLTTDGVRVTSTTQHGQTLAPEASPTQTPTQVPTSADLSTPTQAPVVLATADMTTRTPAQDRSLPTYVDVSTIRPTTATDATIVGVESDRSNDSGDTGYMFAIIGVLGGGLCVLLFICMVVRVHKSRHRASMRAEDRAHNLMLATLSMTENPLFTTTMPRHNSGRAGTNTFEPTDTASSSLGPMLRQSESNTYVSVDDTLGHVGSTTATDAGHGDTNRNSSSSTSSTASYVKFQDTHGTPASKSNSLVSTVSYMKFRDPTPAAGGPTEHSSGWSVLQPRGIVYDEIADGDTPPATDDRPEAGHYRLPSSPQYSAITEFVFDENTAGPPDLSSHPYLEPNVPISVRPASFIAGDDAGYLLPGDATVESFSASANNAPRVLAQRKHSGGEYQSPSEFIADDSEMAKDDRGYLVPTGTLDRSGRAPVVSDYQRPCDLIVTDHQHPREGSPRFSGDPAYQRFLGTGPGAGVSLEDHAMSPGTTTDDAHEYLDTPDSASDCYIHIQGMDDLSA
eukprot:m.34382 g.34382  ORF g.34382 m.34382 type:complete len:915 (+) comp14297_c0_seq1:122-2866(+)